MTGPRKGDRVRVTFDAEYVSGDLLQRHEGVVAYDHTRHGKDYYVPIPANARIDILGRQYAVGDELTGKEVAEGDFDVGTVIVHCTWTDLVYVKGPIFWRDKGGFRTDGFGGVVDQRYRILYLPAESDSDD